MIRIAIPSPTKRGAFAVVRMGRGILKTLETDGCGTLAAAQREANRLNQAYDREQARSAPIDPADRPIPAGFYTDQDAS